MRDRKRPAQNDADAAVSHATARAGSEAVDQHCQAKKNPAMYATTPSARTHVTCGASRFGYNLNADCSTPFHHSLTASVLAPTYTTTSAR